MIASISIKSFVSYKYSEALNAWDYPPPPVNQNEKRFSVSIVSTVVFDSAFLLITVIINSRGFQLT